nr:CKLF-like MARVEL transmembrane domain-containing protein 3 isoform X2 [Macaca nemestrina]
MSVACVCVCVCVCVCERERDVLGLGDCRSGSPADVPACVCVRVCLRACVCLGVCLELRLQGLSFITFICYVASSASAFLTAPLLEFLLALFFLFADAMQLNDKWQGLCWPMMDFLRCVTAALIYFAISITAVAKYSDGASKAAGVFGFFATIVFAIDFYLIFNDVAKFLKQGDSADETTAHKTEEENSDSDSD